MRRICEKNLRQSERLFYQCFPNAIITQNISFHNLYLWDNKKIEYLPYAASKGTVASPPSARCARHSSVKGESEYTVILSLPRYHGERSTSTNHTSLSLVFLGRFPIRPVTQSASSCGLASWTGQQGGPRKRWKGHKEEAVTRSLRLHATAPWLDEKFEGIEHVPFLLLCIRS